MSWWSTTKAKPTTLNAPRSPILVSKSQPTISTPSGSQQISGFEEKKQEINFNISIDRDGEAPPILSQLVRYLQTKGIVEGIFQVVPPAGKELQTLRRKLMTEREALLLSSVTNNPHVVAEVTKEFLTNLPEPLLTFDLYDWFAFKNFIISIGSIF